MQIQVAVKESVGQLPNLVAIQIAARKKETQKRFLIKLELNSMQLEIEIAIAIEMKIEIREAC